MEKQAVTGRLVCDLKISAKELIRYRTYIYFCLNSPFILGASSDKRRFLSRCKSYELSALVEKLLKKSPRPTSGEGECYEMRKAYETSKRLVQKAQECATDAWDTLKVGEFRYSVL